MKTLQAQAKNPKTNPHTRLMFFAYLLAIGVLAVFSYYAEATTLISQTVSDTEMTRLVSSGVYPYQPIGTNLSGTPLEVSLYLETNSINPNGVYVYLRSYNDAGLTSVNYDYWCISANNDMTANQTKVLKTFDSFVFAYAPNQYDPCTFNPSLYYTIYIGVGGGDFVGTTNIASAGNIYGSSVDYIGGSVVNPYGGIVNYYVVMYDLLGETIYDNSISLVEPINSTTTPSTNVDLYIDYYNNGDFDTINWVGYYESNNFNSALNSTTTASTGLIVGDTINVDFDTNSSVLWKACLSSIATTTTTSLCTSLENFNVVSNPYPDLIGVDSWEDSFGLSTTTCSIGNIAGCFQNSIIFLLKPSQNSFDLIIGLKDDILYKPPFGYFMVIKDSMTTLESTTTPAYTWEIPTPVADMFAPFKTGMAWILWVLFGFWTLRAFSKLQL